MQHIVDAFIQAVEDARRELIRREGQNISIRALIRRAGFDEAKRSGVAYHLNPNRHRGERPHRVPVELIERLAQVLPISEEELSRAAAIASGLNVVDTDVTASDVRYVVSRFYGSDEVTPEERAAATSHILQVIAEETSRQRPLGPAVDGQSSMPPPADTPGPMFLSASDRR
jgi:hypothetical protein